MADSHAYHLSLSVRAFVPLTGLGSKNIQTIMRTFFVGAKDESPERKGTICNRITSVGEIGPRTKRMKAQLRMMSKTRGRTENRG